VGLYVVSGARDNLKLLGDFLLKGLCFWEAVSVW
jgi:hypothetical protein